MRNLLVAFAIVVIIGAGIYFYFSKPTGGNGTGPTGTSSSETTGDIKAINKAIATAKDWVVKNQNKDGGWGIFGSDESDPGMTGLMLKGLLLSGYKVKDNPWMQKAMDYQLSFQKEDGSFFKQSLQSYITAITVSTLALADREKYAKEIEAGKKYLLSIQFKPGQARTTKDWYEGGVNYNDEPKAPNLSTTVYALEALRHAGLSKNDEAFKNAAKFISRCQNRTESNDKPLDILLSNDGGFFYKPGDTRGEKVENPDGTVSLRSYGSMTYAGLLGLVYCNLGVDDPRVKSALEWVQRNYTFEANPGMKNPSMGLYYYLNAIAKVINAAEMRELPDGKPIMLDLAKAILKLQNPDGSWINGGEDRWYEGNPVLCTGYMLGALGNIKNLMTK